MRLQIFALQPAKICSKICAFVLCEQALEPYYSGGVWRQDYDDDCAGKIPCELKRGVLSEDAVYDLLTDNNYLLKRLRELGKCWGLFEK